MKYSEAYDKIIQAYFKDEIKPGSNRFCFCGTLSPNENWRWNSSRKGKIAYPYSINEYLEMETALFTGMSFILKVIVDGYMSPSEFGLLEDHPKYEDALFQGMVNALEALKQIHIERGEIIDEASTFTKRLIPA